MKRRTALCFSARLSRQLRGDVAGSQKQYGFLIPAESENCDTVEIYEAPIDAMSGATLRQYKHDSPWRSVHYLALGG